MTDTLQPAEQKHIAFMNALRAVQQQHDRKLTVDEMVQITSQFIGGLIAQLPAGYTLPVVMDTISVNIGHGNAAMIEALLIKSPEPEKLN